MKITSQGHPRESALPKAGIKMHFQHDEQDSCDLFRCSHHEGR